MLGLCRLLRRGWRWIWIAVAAVGAALAVVLLRRRASDELAGLRREIDAVRAEAEAEKLVARVGKERALLELRERHAAEIAELEAEDAERVEKVQDDPAALSRLLVRAGRSSRGPGDD